MKAPHIFLASAHVSAPQCQSQARKNEEGTYGTYVLLLFAIILALTCADVLLYTNAVQ